jgi:copper resistance protein C
MTAHRHTSAVPARSRRLPAVLLTAGCALVVLLGPASPARAHDELRRTAPAAAATVTAPASVDLEFSGAPQPLGVQVLVTGPDGAAVAQGAARVADTVVTQPLVLDLPAGGYTVEWRVTSADGHPLTGTFAFAVAGNGAGTGSAAPGTPAARPDAAPVAESAAGAPAAGFPVVWLVAGAAVLLAGVLAAGRRLRGRP